MKKTTPIFFLAVAFLAGCGGQQATYVDSKGTGTITSLDKVDIQDFSIAADALLNSLYDSPAFNDAPRKPPIIAVSRITNNTSTQFDTDQLMQKIRTSITRSGKARISRAVGADRDALTRDAQATASHTSGATPNNTPDYTLIGKILETGARAGKTRQITYTFQLSLVEVKSATDVWSDEKEITKQGSKAAVGW
ncbi:MAG: hypothetical protein LBS59_05690 [Puniceicoccales bacterium]|jgi:uncharacterized protein (TIGR02722 family)|nr:hypothetical protein [Puniceicoccales bacterium]